MYKIADYYTTLDDSELFARKSKFFEEIKNNRIKSPRWYIRETTEYNIEEYRSFKMKFKVENVYKKGAWYSSYGTIDGKDWFHLNTYGKTKLSEDGEYKAYSTYITLKGIKLIYRGLDLTKLELYGRI